MADMVEKMGFFKRLQYATNWEQREKETAERKEELDRKEARLNQEKAKILEENEKEKQKQDRKQIELDQKEKQLDEREKQIREKEKQLGEREKQLAEEREKIAKMQAEILEMQKKTKTIANAFLEKKGISEKQITTQQITRDKMTINALDEIQKDIKEYMRLRKGETKLLQKDEALRIKQLEAIKARTYGVIMAYMDSIPAEEQAQIIINGKSAREYLYEEAKKIIPEEGRKSKKEEMDARGAKTDFINTLNLSFSYEFLQEVFDTYVKTSEKIGALENSVNSRKITDVSDYNVLRSNHYNYGYSHEVMRSRTSS